MQSLSSDTSETLYFGGYRQLEHGWVRREVRLPLLRITVVKVFLNHKLKLADGFLT